jgi:hypothetical protein
VSNHGSQKAIIRQEISIKHRIRRAILTRAITFGAKRLIVVLTPGYDWRKGGIISIATIYRQIGLIRDLHRASVALCSVPGEPLLAKYTWFKNRNYILDLESVLDSCRRLDYFQLHIPAYAVNQVSSWLNSPSGARLRDIPEVHFNILLQNIDVIEGRPLSGLMPFGRVTCTTAHEAYTSAAFREALGVTLHRLGVYNGPEDYSPTPYQEKEPLLVVSHDEHPLKARVLEHIARTNPNLKIEVVHNISYEEYRELIGRAKWSLTFGEGLDSYFAEVAWSGGVPFAVFNNRYFTPAFAKLQTLYPSWEILLAKMPFDLQRLDEPIRYDRCWREIYDLLNTLYGKERFRANLRAFYRGEYTFP